MACAPRPRSDYPYVNTIPVEEEAPYPGDRAIERRIKSLIRWNAAAMVVRANKYDPEHRRPHFDLRFPRDDHEVGFNHFFRASYGDQPGDLIYFQGHCLARRCTPALFSKAG